MISKTLQVEYKKEVDKAKRRAKKLPKGWELQLPKSLPRTKAEYESRVKNLKAVSIKNYKKDVASLSTYLRYGGEGYLPYFANQQRYMLKPKEVAKMIRANEIENEYRSQKGLEPVPLKIGVTGKKGIETYVKKRRSVKALDQYYDRKARTAVNNFQTSLTKQVELYKEYGLYDNSEYLQKLLETWNSWDFNRQLGVINDVYNDVLTEREKYEESTRNETDVFKLSMMSRSVREAESLWAELFGSDQETFSDANLKKLGELIGVSWNEYQHVKSKFKKANERDMKQIEKAKARGEKDKAKQLQKEFDRNKKVRKIVEKGVEKGYKHDASIKRSINDTTQAKERRKATQRKRNVDRFNSKIDNTKMELGRMVDNKSGALDVYYEMMDKYKDTINKGKRGKK